MKRAFVNNGLDRRRGIDCKSSIVHLERLYGLEDSAAINTLLLHLQLTLNYSISSES